MENVEGKEILIRSIEGFHGAQLPAMSDKTVSLDSHYYTAAEDGFIHFPPNALLHANHLNDLLRAEEKAAFTIKERAALAAAKQNSTARLEEAIAKAAGGKTEVAAAVATAVGAMIPDLMKQIREELRAEMQQGGQGKADKK